LFEGSEGLAKYPWYDVVEGEDIEQGDLLRDCPIITPLKDIPQEGLLDANVEFFNVVVMSQSCDIAQRKIGIVLVCPFWELSAFVKSDQAYASKKRREEVRRGDLPGLHMLIGCDIEGFKSDHLIVDFRNVYGIALPAAISLAEKNGKRLRLLPPYKERLSQSFAKFFMRVGLPEDIPSFI
jgi:hypothetical protein